MFKDLKVSMGKSSRKVYNTNFDGFHLMYNIYIYIIYILPIGLLVLYILFGMG